MALRQTRSRNGRTTFVPGGYRGPTRAKTEARHLDELSNEMAARKAGVFEALDRGVSTQAKLRVAVLDAGRALFHRRGGRGLEMYRGRLRVDPHAVLAKREKAHARARASGLRIPAISDRHRGQDTACWFTVIAVGAEVRGVDVGDEVLASAWIGEDLSHLLGSDIFRLWADGYPCDLELRWDDVIAHGTLDAMALGCRCGGDLLAVRPRTDSTSDDTQTVRP